jgi:hypothetical protein
MRQATVVAPRPIKVIQNANSRSVAWAKIIDARYGTVLHTGKPAYIAKVAKDRYAHDVTYLTPIAK